MMHSLLQHEHGGSTVLRRLHLEFDLPDEVLAHLRDEDIAMKAKEALVMELLREHHLSQGKVAEILDIDRHALFDLMTKYQVPVIDLTEEELQAELNSPFPRS
jgi:predicted HTH domain antitoxin